MSKDRIKDLEKKTAWPSVSYSSLSQELPSNELPDTNSRSSMSNIDDQSDITNFLQEVRVIQSVIDKIDNLTQQVKNIHTEILKPTANFKLRHELDQKTAEIKKLCYETSKKLTKIEKPPDDRSETEAKRRIREYQVFVLTQSFRNTMIKYNEETVSYYERYKQCFPNELELGGNRRSSDDLEEILESDSLNSSVLVDREKAKKSLNQIKARRQDLVQLENSIKELHYMFLELAILVENQGELIDSIEHDFVKVGGYVADATQNVNTAITNRKEAIEVNASATNRKEAAKVNITAAINPKRRIKKRNLIFIIVIIIAAVILTLSIILFTVIIHKKSVGR